MKKLIQISMIVLCLPMWAYGQDDAVAFGYYLDALRFAQTELGGSARIQSLGQAQIALGGDMSSALSNPAGLGLFTRSEVSITPVLNFKTIESNYLGTVSDESNTKFNIGQAGIVLQSNPESSGGSFKGGSFAITLTRINDFNNNYTIRGTNLNTSMIDAFIEAANGATVEQFTGNDVLSLAYFNYLIGPESILDPPGPPDQYFTDVTGIPFQQEIVQTRGKQNQWSLAYGANFSDKFYIGVGLGILSLDYRSEKIYSESFDVDPVSDWTLRENLSIVGTGVNGTLGFLARPTPSFRIGVSLITPSIYAVEDTYDASMFTNWNNYLYEDGINGDTLLNNLSAETDILVSNYRINTPLKLNGGLAFFFGKNGFVTADVQFVDYSNTKLSTDDFSMKGDNLAIENLANSVVNFRMGGEYRYKMYKFRAGYAFYGSPLDSDEVFYGDNQSFSAGAGIRIQSWHFDLGAVYRISDSLYSPYFIQGDTPVADVSSTNTSILFTVGFNY